MKNSTKKNSERPLEVAGGLTQSGQLVELIQNPETTRTTFVVGDEKQQECMEEIVLKGGRHAIPLSADNNLIKHEVLRIPSATENHADSEILHISIQQFIQSYCEIDEDYAALAAAYVMLTWCYDRFDELPYLRIQGSFGTGKTRFLKVMGSLCYKALHASGASSISPIFHSLDQLRGTLILDEADYRFTDERAEITKLLNNGNVRGFPILRCLKSADGVFNPQAFRVYGPKIVATRGFYQDPALESRFITHTAKPRKAGSTVPITLPPHFHEEALSLRNQLLAYRFTHFNKPRILPDLPEDVTDRIAQIYLPLLSVAPTSPIRSIIARYAQSSNENILTYHKEPELLVLEAIALQVPFSSVISIKQIADHLCIPPRSVGHTVRSKLGLKTVKREGRYIVPETEYAKLTALLDRWGVGGDTPVSSPNTPPASNAEPVIEF